MALTSRSIPLELCETIIDHCAPHHPGDMPYPFGSLEWPRSYIEDAARTLKACALTCRDWVSRSQFNYYSTCLILRNTEDVDRLVVFLAKHPHFAAFVRQLSIHSPMPRRVWSGSQYTTEYAIISFTRMDLVQKLRNLRTICYSGPDNLRGWPYPTLWNSHFAQLQALTTLRLSSPFRRPVDVCRLVWALEKLQSLFLDVSFTMTWALGDPLDPGYRKLRSLASRRRRCASLKTLVLERWPVSDSWTFPYAQTFGCSLIRFGMCSGDPDATSWSMNERQIERYISSLAELRELKLRVIRPTPLASGPPEDYVSGVVSWLKNIIMPRAQSCKHLRRIVLDLSLWTPRANELLFTAENSLDEALNRIPNLHEVAIHHDVRYDKNLAEKETDWIRKAMRKLEANLSIVVS